VEDAVLAAMPQAADLLVHIKPEEELAHKHYVKSPAISKSVR
jgi:hypothetical protein